MFLLLFPPISGKTCNFLDVLTCIIFGGVKQKPEIRQCSQAMSEAAGVTRKLYVLERFLCFLHQFDRAFVSRAQCLGL